MRWFNTAGPVKPDTHYCIPPLSRIDLDDALGLVRDEKYFVLHAPRQTGKTSALLALADVLNERGYHCVYVTVETARTARDDVQRAMRTVLFRLASEARETLDDGFLDDIWQDALARAGADEALGDALSRWAQASPRPLVLLGQLHRRDRPSVRGGGDGSRMDADARSAVAGERAGVRYLLREQGAARESFAHGDRGRHRRGARGPHRQPGDAPGLPGGQAPGGAPAAGHRADAERRRAPRLRARRRVRARPGAGGAGRAGAHCQRDLRGGDTADLPPGMEDRRAAPPGILRRAASSPRSRRPRSPAASRTDRSRWARSNRRPPAGGRGAACGRGRRSRPADGSPPPR